MSIDELLQQVERIRQRYPTEAPRPRWQDIQGTAPYPLAGEDAQAWVSSTRREGDEHGRLPLLSIRNCPDDFSLDREDIYS